MYGRVSRAANNIVKLLLEYTSSIPRERLRLRKGRGTTETDLTPEKPSGETTRQDHGGHRGQSKGKTSADSGGESDV